MGSTRSSTAPRSFRSSCSAAWRSSPRRSAPAPRSRSIGWGRCRTSKCARGCFSKRGSIGRCVRAFVWARRSASRASSWVSAASRSTRHSADAPCEVRGFRRSSSCNGDVPLGKGRGRVSAGSAERAAELSAQAAREALRNQVAEEAVSHRGRVRRARGRGRTRRHAEDQPRAWRGSLRRSARRWWRWARLPRIERGRVAGRVAALREAVTPGRHRGDHRAAQPRRSDGRASDQLCRRSARHDAAAARRAPARCRTSTRSSRRRGCCATIRSPSRRLRDAAAALSAAAVADLRPRRHAEREGRHEHVLREPLLPVLPGRAAADRRARRIPDAGRRRIIPRVRSNLQWCMETLRARVSQLRPAARRTVPPAAGRSRRKRRSRAAKSSRGISIGPSTPKSCG